MLDFEATRWIRFATLVLALVAVHSFFAARNRKKRPKPEFVHVATGKEAAELRSSGLPASGRVVGIYASSPSSEDLSPPLVPELLTLLVTAVAYFLYQVVKDLRKGSKRDQELRATPPPVKLSGGVDWTAIHLLYEFELEWAGESTTFRGGYAFRGKPYQAVEMVGKEVEVRYSAEDPSVSMVEAGVPG